MHELRLGCCLLLRFIWLPRYKNCVYLKRHARLSLIRLSEGREREREGERDSGDADKEREQHPPVATIFSALSPLRGYDTGCDLSLQKTKPTSKNPSSSSSSILCSQLCDARIANASHSAFFLRASFSSADVSQPPRLIIFGHEIGCKTRGLPRSTPRYTRGLCSFRGIYYNACINPLFARPRSPDRPFLHFCALCSPPMRFRCRATASPPPPPPPHPRMASEIHVKRAPSSPRPRPSLYR